MTVTSEQVAHKSLVDGSQISLHSHAGGGGGAIIKAGSAITNGSGAATVTFGTAFSDTNYFISLTVANPGEAAMGMYSNKATTGFDILVKNDKNQTVGSATVDWIAIKI